MAAERIHIEKFIELAAHHPVFDVRSPGEYTHAHFPGAYSMPLFSDEERKIVGTAYKQESREQAIKLGLDFFGPKMRKMVDIVEGISKRECGIGNEDSEKQSQIPNSKILLVYCWRGGMRSGAVSWLLDMYGFKVYTLAGGYKKFRNLVLDTFKLPFQINILGGYTGSGKTELLKTLKEKGETIIDLEGIANHKGSAFGNIGMPEQMGQEMFENLLATELRKSIVNSPKGPLDDWSIKDASHSPFTIHHSPLWLEDESQRIGRVNIPTDLWKNMRQSPVFFLDIPFDERLKHIVQEYGQLEREKVAEAIERISQKLGNLNAKTATLLLNEGKITESFDILLKYYDKFYFKSLHNREGIQSLLHIIECTTVCPENTTATLVACEKIIHLNKQMP